MTARPLPAVAAVLAVFALAACHRDAETGPAANASSAEAAASDAAAGGASATNAPGAATQAEEAAGVVSSADMIPPEKAHH